MKPTQARPERISTLDGFRALAIFPVICFHLFSRWTPPLHEVDLYPYGAAYQNVLLFRYGYLGVQFFFVISGFVISMTLASSSGHWDFFVKRISRLWPAMLLCSCLTFVTLVLVPGAPFPAPVANFFPSLLFMEPYVAGKLLRHPVEWMDGAYWSLSVEVRFYFWAALLYFAARTRFLQVFTGFSAVVLLLTVVIEYQFPRLIHTADLMFFPIYLSWFTMGIGFYAIYAQQRPGAFPHVAIAGSFAVLVVQAFLERNMAPKGSSFGIELVVYLAVVAAFYTFIYRPQWLAFFGWWPVSTLGAASYSLYLLHQHIGVTLVRYLTPALGAPPEAVAIGVIALLVGVSLLVSRYWETPAKRIIQRLLLPARASGAGWSVATVPAARPSAAGPAQGA